MNLLWRDSEAGDQDCFRDGEGTIGKQTRVYVGTTGEEKVQDATMGMGTARTCEAFPYRERQTQGLPQTPPRGTLRDAYLSVLKHTDMD